LIDGHIRLRCLADASSETMGSRKYYLDWLRVLAFLGLIVFHVGCLYASWDYNIKSPRLEPAIDWALLALTPWRMALLFIISGVASRYLIAKLGPQGFALDRARRLIPVILVGTFVVIPPQTYIMLIDKGLLQAGYFHFWIFSYLAADQTLVAPLHRTMPTYDHLWFIVYLLFYTLIFAAVSALLRVLVRLLRGRRTARRGLPLYFLLVIPALWLIVTNFLIERRLPATFYVLNDWGSHLKWAGLFVIGILCAPREDFWSYLRRRRGSLLVLSLLFLTLQSACRAIWLRGQMDPLSSALAWSAATSLYACTMMGALCGYAQVHLNQRSALLSHLNEAILPIYVLHQPILLISAYLIFPFHLPLPAEAALLVSLTGLGALAIYETLIRPFQIMRVLFGLKRRETPSALQSSIINGG
jgi:glucans biosynthesis protein C